MNLHDEEILLKEYDPLQLMIYQNVISQIDENAEEKISLFINNSQDVERTYVSVWVNESLFNFFKYMKNYGVLNKYFKHDINFTINKRMKDNEFVIFNIGIKIHTSFPVLA